MPLETAPIDWNTIKVAYAAGASLRELARELGIPEGTVMTKANREGWTQQIAEAKDVALRAKGVNAIESRSANPVVGLMAKHGEKTKLRLAKGLSKGALAVSRKDGDYILAQASNVKCLVDASSKLHGWGQDAEGSKALVNINVLGVQPEGIP
jgi:hypothetical protein